MAVTNLQDFRARGFLANSEKIIKTLRDIHSSITEIRSNNEQLALKKVTNPHGKKLLTIDDFAETAFKNAVTKVCGDSVVVTGEESLPRSGVDYTDSQKIHLLCDIIDGTDLFVRGLSNWCSAFVAFEPSRRRIISSHVFVVDRGVDTLYTATEGADGVERTEYQTFLTVIDNKQYYSVEDVTITESIEHFRIFEPQINRDLADAGLFTYGQKLKNFGVMSEFLLNNKVSEHLSGLEDVRFYNLAGNPMMCRILEGKADVVFDLAGQAAHDVIPGAFIALKGKAVMYELPELKGGQVKSVKPDDLVEYLYRPCSGDTRIRYVIASHDALAKEFLELCRLADLI